MSAQRIYLLASVILSLGPRLGRFEQMLPHNPCIHLNLCNESMKQNERSLVLRCMFHIHAFLSHFWVTDELRFTEFQMDFERKAEYTLNWSPASHRECFGGGIPTQGKMCLQWTCMHIFGNLGLSWNTCRTSTGSPCKLHTGMPGLGFEPTTSELHSRHAHH